MRNLFTCWVRVNNLNTLHSHAGFSEEQNRAEHSGCQMWIIVIFPVVSASWTRNCIKPGSSLHRRALWDCCRDDHLVYIAPQCNASSIPLFSTLFYIIFCLFGILLELGHLCPGSPLHA